MKKLLLFLLLPFLSFSQMNIDKICDFTATEAESYAMTVINSAPKQYRLLKLTKNENSIEYTFVPETLSDEEIKSKELSFHQANSISVSFEKYLKGKNADLEIPGIETFRLQRIYGKFLNIFPFWQKYYVPESNLDNYKEYEMRNFKKNRMLIKFEDDDDGFWYINKFYCP